MNSFLRQNLKIILPALTTGVVWLVSYYFGRACAGLKIPTDLSPGVDYFPELSYQCTIARVSDWAVAVLIILTLIFVTVEVVQRRKAVKKNQSVKSDSLS